MLHGGASVGAGLSPVDEEANGHGADQQPHEGLEVAHTEALHGEEHDTRKRVARYIIKCAKSGRTTLPELTEAGQQALAKVAAAAE